MKKLLVLLALVAGLHSFAQRVYPTTITGLNALVYVPKGVDTTQPVNIMLFTPGSGEQGTNAALLTVHGPFLYLKTGVDNGCKAVVVAVQNINPNPRPVEMASYIAGIAKLYKINRLMLTGLSRGGQNAEWYAEDSVANLKQLAGLILFSSQGSPTGFNPTIFQKNGIVIFRGEGDQDFTWDYNNNAQKALAAIAPALNYWVVWPGVGHADPVWSDGYNPFPVFPNPVFIALKKSIYQLADSIMGNTPIPIIYKSAAESQSFLKTNCSCGTPVAILYTVPAGKYTSTVSQAAADQQAMGEIATNGQVFANLNGTCTPTLIMTIQVFSDGSIIKTP